MAVGGVNGEYVDCTPLLVALLLRAAKDTHGKSEHTAEARQWLAEDGMAVAASLGVDLQR